jgi:hypothetical protein
LFVEFFKEVLAEHFLQLEIASLVLSDLFQNVCHLFFGVTITLVKDKDRWHVDRVGLIIVEPEVIHACEWGHIVDVTNDPVDDIFYLDYRKHATNEECHRPIPFNRCKRV